MLPDARGNPALPIRRTWTTVLPCRGWRSCSVADDAGLDAWRTSPARGCSVREARMIWSGARRRSIDVRPLYTEADLAGTGPSGQPARHGAVHPGRRATWLRGGR